jgi:hypothetical protein
MTIDLYIYIHICANKDNLFALSVVAHLRTGDLAWFHSRSWVSKRCVVGFALCDRKTSSRTTIRHITSSLANEWYIIFSSMFPLWSHCCKVNTDFTTDNRAIKDGGRKILLAHLSVDAHTIMRARGTRTAFWNGTRLVKFAQSTTDRRSLWDNTRMEANVMNLVRARMIISSQQVSNKNDWWWWW